MLFYNLHYSLITNVEISTRFYVALFATFLYAECPKSKLNGFNGGNIPPRPPPMTRMSISLVDDDYYVRRSFTHSKHKPLNYAVDLLWLLSILCCLFTGHEFSYESKSSGLKRTCNCCASLGVFYSLRDTITF